MAKLAATPWLLLAALLVPCALAATVADIATEDSDLELFVAALIATGLVDSLMDPAFNSTVFAPSDEAFGDVPLKFLEPEWKYHMKEILLYHFVGGIVTSSDLEVNKTYPMLNGEDANVTSLDPPMINGANILAANIEADNGLVHVIDQVLLPNAAKYDITQAVLAIPQLSRFVNLIAGAELGPALGEDGPYTLFAPINSAFEVIPNETLAYFGSEEGQPDLQHIVGYHLTTGIFVSLDANPGTNEVPMLNNELVYADVPDSWNLTTVTDSANATALGEDYIWLNGDEARVIVHDILVKNGVIHLIDGILSPPTAVDDGEEEDGVVDEMLDAVEDMLEDVVATLKNPDGEI